jgi:hypothetical protein
MDTAGEIKPLRNISEIGSSVHIPKVIENDIPIAQAPLDMGMGNVESIRHDDRGIDDAGRRAEAEDVSVFDPLTPAPQHAVAATDRQLPQAPAAAGQRDHLADLITDAIFDTLVEARAKSEEPGSPASFIGSTAEGMADYSPAGNEAWGPGLDGALGALSVAAHFGMFPKETPPPAG